MADQHTDPEDAVRIMQDIGARHALGIHWGTFQLTDEGREAPVAELQQALSRHELPFDMFKAAVAGERYEFPSAVSQRDSGVNEGRPADA